MPNMRILGVAAALSLGLGTMACSSSSDDGSPETNGLACGENQLKVTGAVDGADVNLVRSVTTYAFQNKFTDDPGSADASTAQGTLSLEFNKSLFDGESGPARGSFTDTEGALAVGNCETGDFVSALSMDADGNGVHFTLRSLKREPYCTGAAAAGDLSGCLGFMRF
jgi:hypothetical protein